MPKASSQKDEPAEADVIYASPLQLKPSRVLIGLLVGVVIIAIGVFGARIFSSVFDSGATSVKPVEIKTGTSSAETATSSAQKSETEGWKSYENEGYKYSLKFPKSWYVSTETKVVSEENNIVYHFYAVSKDKNLTLDAKDEVVVVRYLEGDPCAALEIKKSDITVSGYNGQRSDCYEGDQIKVIVFSFPNTDREEWFIVAYIDKEPGLIEKIISTIKFLD